jgi:selenocysteine lyase/cysteine desulfurase
VTNANKDLFEIAEDVTYLNCANMAPQMRSLTEAGLDAVRAREAPWNMSASDWFSGAERVRSLAAMVMGSESDAIALVPSVSYGVAVAAANLPMRPGQSIVLLDQEFPSNVYAWRKLATNRGGRVNHVKRRNGMSWTDALEEAIDNDTAIVSIPQCHWTDGSRIDLERVADQVHKVGAGLVIDASQSLGAQVLNLNRAAPDFLVAVGYKWLLGPYGLGYLWVAPKWREKGEPLEQSWLTRAGSEDFTRLVEYTDRFRAGSRRFDMGEFPQFLLTPMAAVALQQILDWGVPHIASTLAILTDRIAEIAFQEGYSVHPAAQRCTHMIGIRSTTGLPERLAGRLKEERVFVSIRGDSIRVAPHLYNDFNDIDRLFEIMRGILRTS